MSELIKLIKEHLSVITFLFAIFTSLIAFVVYLDTEQDIKLGRQIVEPMVKDIHDEILVNRDETLKNREINETTRNQVQINIGKINELEKQTVRIETKIDTMIQMLKDNNNKKTK